MQILQIKLGSSTGHRPLIPTPVQLKIALNSGQIILRLADMHGQETSYNYNNHAETYITLFMSLQ